MTVRFSDGGCVHDVRKLQQRLFDQAWIDIVAAADDDVLGAAGDKDEPILVDATEIAADQPAILGAGIILVREIEVACLLCWSFDLEYADIVGATEAAPRAGAADRDCADLRVRYAETRAAFL